MYLLLFLCFFHSCFATYSLDDMTLEEKVGQLLMVQFYGEGPNEDARVLIQEVGVGGIIYYDWCNKLHSLKEIQALSCGLQGLAKYPLLIACDQEGGVVSRFKEAFTQFPGNRALGETEKPELAWKAAYALGMEMKAVGINMNFAPVVDVNCNPRNPVIGVRAFSNIPSQVVAFGREALSGYRRAGIIATLKHYPGHGDTGIDSHEALAIVNKSKEELEQVELFPFIKLAKEPDAIMTAHIVVPALDSENCATLSRKALDYLRETIGFQGVIVSDSLVMEGVLKKCVTVDEAAIQALSAGCDLLLLGGKLLTGERAGFELKVTDIQRIHASIVGAVKMGRISEARVNEAVGRILDLKSRSFSNLEVKIGNHQEIADEIARLALKVTSNGWNAMSPDMKVSIYAPRVLENAINQTSLHKLGKIYFDNELHAGEESDVIVICTYNAWKNLSEIKWIQSLIDLGKPAILCVTRDPLDAALFPQCQLVFQTFSPTPCSIQSICNYLESSP